MLCPNCKRTYDENFIGNNCPHCNVDVVIFSRAVCLSQRLYNQGLERVRASDFTRGIELLTKSVAIDKENG